ncbi:RIP metalloprotease RseP [Loktanella sp. SALINAS62]|uniref:RIP metalloprotease RseP n=1 Tax=Loktanella sp. SALINAS62 TaxID=2706124 RepID=UPI001B8BA255|nr:RIP metalloprotease RseP [Loktanella sp. SALINAS62]MBS1303646.1 RIP metalloprotease RseP [Loktanella sp. SALINAS62]
MDLTTILPSVGGGLFTLVAFVVSLSIIVTIHEYGHYIVGRWSGIHAEVFSVGFGPVLFSRKDKRGTVWQVAALPLGGYVKFLGDANAASVGGDDTVAAGRDARHTMLGAPLWARAATVAAGPLFNFALTILIFAGYLMWVGTPSDPMTVKRVFDLPPSFATGLEPGDEVLAIGGQPLEDDTPVDTLPIAPSVDYTVLRDGAQMIVTGPYPVPPRAAGVTPRSAADDAGLRIGDVITAVDGVEINAFAELVDIVRDAEGDALLLDVWRDGDTRNVTLSPRRVDLPLPEGGFETRWLIGISGDLFFSSATESVGPFEALWTGVQQLWLTLRVSVSGLWHVITGAISTCNISGPVGIAETSSTMASQGAGNFILFIASLSAAVGLLNLFPIPILDGGHLVFHAYEAIFRRKPTDGALRVLMAGGLALILTFMLFAILNDIWFCP